MLDILGIDFSELEKSLGVLPYDTLIIRLSGEIPIKSEGVRRYWERKLSRFLVNYVRGFDGGGGIKVVSERGRLYLYFSDFIKKAHLPLIKRVVRTFGFSSISPAIRCKSELDALKKCLEQFVSKYLEIANVKTFGIFAKKSLSPLFGTTELRYDLGAFVKERFNLAVNLDNPDLPIYVDARERLSYVYIKQFYCYGGLPFGVQEPLTVMFSGGPDSTLAAWLTIRRGSPIVLLFFDFGDAKLRVDAKIRALRIAEILFKDWTPIPSGELIVLPFDDVVKSIFRNVDNKNYYYVLLKRFMYRFASIINSEKRGHGLVTGEIIGEHASQTVWNLSVLTQNFDTPIFRPVLGFDKSDIFRILKKIDVRLYSYSSKSIEPCKIITGVRPTTRANKEKILQYEKKILQELNENRIKDILDSKEVISF